MASKNQKFWKQVLAEVESQRGMVVDRTSRNSHVKVTREGHKTIVWLPSTPSDYRGMQNAIALLRRELDFVWKNR